MRIKRILERILNKINEYRANQIMKKEYKEDKSFFLIQIGSNDGITGDPIYKFICKYKPKGILIEPVKYLFQKLQETYKGFNNLIFENIAISEKTGKKYFYRIKKKTAPNISCRYDQLGSFNKNTVIKHKSLIPNFAKYFIKEKIECISFMDLLKKHKVNKINLLSMDVEGYDYEIVKKIDFNKIKPKMILYEHKHLSKGDRENCTRKLKKNGYKLIYMMFDTFAYL